MIGALVCWTMSSRTDNDHGVVERGNEVLAPGGAVP